MEHLVFFVAASLTLIGAAFSKLLADEFKAWAPTIVSSIIAVAVSALPPAQRDRAAEEWTSHVNELPGDLSRVVFACGCVVAALKINDLPFRIRTRILDIALALFFLFSMAPLLIMAAIAVRLTSRGGPTLIRHRSVGLKVESSSHTSSALYESEPRARIVDQARSVTYYARQVSTNCRNCSTS
jgi:hypothetical protein